MEVLRKENSPVLPVHDVRRALDLRAAVVRAPGVDYELHVAALELALQKAVRIMSRRLSAFLGGVPTSM